ncbi:hypothetical protein BXZ70DRAFT_471589 [Cristinia sonorae]|uniref:Uncharacterized protein n=1 Tax=Cristinia sonorae TaxID=1940300 RepID=A0A8K0XLV4_9AGAR|nr:hypothetical protein BXZ70DRAFT_471589 [Cristinia sonorae]
MLSIYRISDLSSRAYDGTFDATLGAVSRLKPPLENKSPASLAFIQMQCATLLLLYPSVQTGLSRSPGIPTFSPDRCDWDLSQPRGSGTLSNMSDAELGLIQQRDILFMKIIRETAGGFDDTPTRRAWLDDLRNDQLVRQWVYVSHRWRVPHQEEISGMISLPPKTLLFDCERFRLPDVSHWGEDLIHVQQVLVTLLRWLWFDQIHDASFGKVDLSSELVDSTLFVLKMETKHAVAVEWYIQRSVKDFRQYLPRIQERSGSLDPSLVQVQAAYEAKLAEIQNTTMLSEKYFLSFHKFNGDRVGGQMPWRILYGCLILTVACRVENLRIEAELGNFFVGEEESLSFCTHYRTHTVLCERFRCDQDIE